MRKIIALSLALCFVFAYGAQAKNVWEMAESDNYGEKAGGMLGRGLFNAVTCFVDMPVGAVNGAKENKPEFLGGVGGFAAGAVCTVFRAASGVIDVATFWIPQFHGIPICRTYGNCFECATGEETAQPVSSYSPPPTMVYQEPAPSTTQQPTESGRMKYVKK